MFYFSNAPFKLYFEEFDFVLVINPKSEMHPSQNHFYTTRILELSFFLKNNASILK